MSLIRFSSVAGLVLATTLALPTVAAAGRDTPGADAAKPAEQAWIRSTIEQMSLAEKVGQLFVPYVDGASADDADPANRAKNLARFGVDTPAEAVSPVSARMRRRMSSAITRALPSPHRSSLTSR